MASLALNLAVGIVTNTLLGWLTPKEGPRIMDLSAPKSSYGQMIPKIIGNCLVGGNVIWAQPKREVKRKAGKGTGNKGATTYAYFGDFAVAICQGPIIGISRIWLNEKIVYDYTYNPTAIYPTQNNPPPNPNNGDKYTVGTKPTGLWSGHEFEVAEWQSGRWYFYPAGSTSRAASNRFARYIRIYNGTDSQQPDPLIQAREGVGRTPAFRGLAYIVFEGLPLSDEPGSLFDFGGNFPRVKVEVVTKGSRHPIDGYFVREETELKEAVKILAMEGGLDASEIDSSALSGSFWGYAITSQKTVRDCIADLISLFHFDLFDGEKLIFLPPERTTAATIKRAELAAHEGNSDRPNDYTHTIVETVTLPYEVALVYFSRERDYQEEMVYGRRATADIRNKNTTQMPVVLYKGQAQTAADIGVHLAWIRRHVYKFALSAKYCRLQAGDRISVEFDFGVEDLVVSRLDLGANLLINIEAYRYTSLTTYGGYIADTAAIMPAPSTITDYGDTLFWLLDIPLIQDSDPDYGIYVAMRGSVPKWRSGVLYYSSDGGANYSVAKRANTPTIMGTVSTALGGWSGSGIDTINTITLELEVGELAAPSGSFLLGNEILSANTVTLIGVRTYQLSNLIRGQRGTDWAIYSHANNERFYLLSTVQRISGVRSDLNQSKLYKAVSSSQALEDVTATNFTYTGKDLEPYPVASVGAYKVGNDIIIQWLRRDRHDADAPPNVAPRLSEFDERYEIDIISAGVPIRTLTSTSPKVTYTAAQQITDFSGTQNQIACVIYQISEVVGRGFPKIFTSGILTTTPPIIPSVPPTPSSLSSEALQKSQNLADVPNKALARQNLEITTWLDISTRSGNYTAQNSERIPCNTGGGSFTITLPATGNIWVYDAIGNSTTTGFGTNPLFLAAPVSSTIMGQNIFTVAIGGAGLILGKVGTDWRIMNFYQFDLTTLIENTIRSFLTAGTNINLFYNSSTNKLIINANGTSAGLLLDDYPNAIGAYSLRQLKTNITNVIRVRRSSDNAERDLTPTEIINGTLSTWCGTGNNGFVVTWYDQSGYNLHVSQTDTNRQPKIFDSSIGLITQNTRPAILWNGTTTYLENTTQGLTTGDYSGFISSFAVNKRTQDVAAIWTERSTPPVKSSQLYLFSGIVYLSSDGLNAANNHTISTASYDATLNVNLMTHIQVAGSRDELYINGLSRTVLTGTGGNVNGNPGFKIGVREGSVGGNFGGYISELVFYGANVTDTRTGIEANINSYYSIF